MKFSLKGKKMFEEEKFEYFEIVILIQGITNRSQDVTIH